MTTLVLDSHVVHRWSAEPSRISRAATKTLTDADELAVAAISWFELGWLAEHERIIVTIPIRSWLDRLAPRCGRSRSLPRSQPRLSPSRRRSPATKPTG